MIWIELEDWQVKKMDEEEALAKQAHKDGQQGSILAQIYPNEKIMRVQFLPAETAIEIKNILKGGR